MTFQIFQNALIYPVADKRVVKERSADTDSACAGNQELNGINGRTNTTLANDGDVMSLGHLMNLMNLQQCDGFDRRTRKTALIVSQNRDTAFYIYSHSHQGIDNRKSVRTCLDTAPGVLSNIGLVGR